MGSLMTRQKQVERKKRYLFLGVGVAGVVTTALLSPWLGLSLIGFSAYLGLNWFKFRAKCGMRF